MKSIILNLSMVSKQEIEKVGAKAANLGELIRNKFSVPEGFIVTTAAYSKFLENNELTRIIQDSLSNINFTDYKTIKECAKKIQDAFNSSQISSDVSNEIKKEYERLDSREVVVRSSATAEDLPSASFAGQYDTFLNLKSFEQVLENVKRCFASVWTSRAISYRHENSIPHDKVKIATIIQKMVDPKSAGILFTTNPISSEVSELLIESNFGLGETVVSGISNPDQFIVHRKGFSILNKRIGQKEVIYIPKSSENESGVEHIELTDQESQQSSLSDKEIVSLAKIGTQIEKIFNNDPQDIEWAIDKNNKIRILQSRPVTSLKSADSTDDSMWSRGYSDDYWNDNVTPLYFELLGDSLTNVVNKELNSIMGYQRIDDKLLKLHKAHAYFNLNVLRRKVENEIPSIMRNKDLMNYFPEGAGTYGKETMKNLPFHAIKRIVAELRIMLYDPNGSMSKTAEAYESWTEETFNPYCDDFDSRLEKLSGTDNISSLIGLAADLDKCMNAHYRLVRYGIPVHNIGMNLLVQYLLTRFLSEEECYQYYPILVSGLQHKLTETNDRVHQLAQAIHDSEELKTIVLEKKSDEIYNHLLSLKNPPIEKFLSLFHEFLKDHGDRGFTRETYYPRWKEPPMINVFDILKSLNTDQWQDLDQKKAKMLRKKEIVEKLVMAKIRSKRLGLIIWKIISIILKNSRKYIIFRENQRFNLDKWITRSRNVYLEIGKILAKQGVISDDTKVFFLKKNEIKKLGANIYNDQEILDISDEVEARYKEFLKYENILPAKFLIGSREFNDVLEFNYDSNKFIGIPASQGTITGPVHVIQDISMISTVRVGEILVVPRTDPGWTPVFSKIAGLITETGGILSHGAVVSREYSIPAVTNITNACKIFQSGQILTINGYNGSIIIKK